MYLGRNGYDETVVACANMSFSADAADSPNISVKVRRGLMVKYEVDDGNGLVVDLMGYVILVGGCGEERRCTLLAIRT